MDADKTTFTFPVPEFMAEDLLGALGGRRMSPEEWREVMAAEERRKEQARAEALTVGRLIELLRGVPEDAPVSVTEYWYDDSETVWADETVVQLKEDGSVHVGW